MFVKKKRLKTMSFGVVHTYIAHNCVTVSILNLYIAHIRLRE